MLGVLSSRIHGTWARVAGGRHGERDTPRYNKTKCFDPFPFPDASQAMKERIRVLAEELDDHRRRRLRQHPKLTYTDMYNALARLRKGEALSDKHQRIHEEALGTILAEIHDRLDAVVAEAYGWSDRLTDEEIIAIIVELNAARQRDEDAGTIRWLRPDFQREAFTQLSHPGLSEIETEPAHVLELRAWPFVMKDQVTAVRAVLGRGASWSSEQVAAAFDAVDVKSVDAVLESLAALGLAVAIRENGRTLWKGGDRLASVRPPPPSARTKMG